MNSRRIGRSFELPIGLLMMATASACSGEQPGEMDDSPQSAIQALYGGGVGRTLWNNDQLGTGATVQVCFISRPLATGGCAFQPDRTRDCNNAPFVNPDGSPLGVDAVRNEVIRNIEDTWQRAANLEFYDWGDCPVDPATNRTIEANSPKNIKISRGNNGGAWGSVGGPGISINWPVLMFGGNHYELIHEFGHALGFAMEGQRTDDYVYPPNCGGDSSEPRDPNHEGFDLTPFPDMESKMDECPPDPTWQLLPVLSPGDVIGAQAAYGRKAEGSIVGLRGKCVNVMNGSSDSGASLVAFPCRGQANDTWKQRNLSENLRTSIGGNARCLRATAGTAGAAVVSSTCDNNDLNERFPMTGVEWRGMGNMCMQATGDNVEAQTCDGSTRQKWTFLNGNLARWKSIGRDASDYGYIQSDYDQRCVTGPTSPGAAGEEMTLATCKPSDATIGPRQRFQFPSRGIVSYRPSSGSLCLNVLGGLPTPGSRVGLWPGCTDDPRPYNEQFYVSGPLTTRGLCLDMAGGEGNTYDGIQVYSCTGGENQKWDYYF